MLQIGKINQIAMEQLSQIYDLSDSDYRLEQFEYDKLKETYTIVVSFLLENKNVELSPFTKISSGGWKFERVFKEVKIHKDGQILGIYIYNPK